MYGRRLGTEGGKIVYSRFPLSHCTAQDTGVVSSFLRNMGAIG